MHYYMGHIKKICDLLPMWAAMVQASMRIRAVVPEPPMLRSEGSGESAHPRTLARTSAARSYKQWVKRNLQTESQIPGPPEWLGMGS